MKYDIVPVSKPRMTQADKWKKRPAVLKFFAFRDEVKRQKVSVENKDTIIFHIQMPKSWGKKKKADMDCLPHQQRPDVDNLLKALLDSVFEEDCEVWNVRVIKLWSYKGSIEINP